jgi:hypothetical protein
MTQATKKYHRYTDINGKKHKQVLPPGRFLKAGEILQETDLYLYIDKKAKTVVQDDAELHVCSVGKDIPGHWHKNLCYRPDPIVKKAEAKVEPEAVFKVGARVKVLAMDVHVGDNVGTIVKVVTDSSFPYRVKLSDKLSIKYASADDATVGMFQINELALVEEPKEEVYPNVKIPGANDPHYYYLVDGDVVEKGDEVITGLGWRPSVEVGKTTNQKQGAERSRRRLITTPPVKKPEPKYRTLKNNEVVRKGDQAYDSVTRGWFNIAINDGFEGYKVKEQPTYRFRRKAK